MPGLAVSQSVFGSTVRRLQGLFGVSALLHEEPDSLLGLLDDYVSLAAEAGVAAHGDLIGVIAGLPSQRLGTNLFEIHRVPGADLPEAS